MQTKVHQNNLSSLFSDDLTINVRKQPFKHLVIDKLFHKPFYNLMCNEFNNRLATGLKDEYGPDRFWKFGHYDAWCWTFNPVKDRVFSNVFYSKHWRKFINNFFDLNLDSNMLAEFHHHKPRSEAGYIHNDYEVVSFMNDQLDNGINPWHHQCDYRGRANDAKHVVRSIAMLYYFNNPAWEEGMGGETGLFIDYGDDAKPKRKIAPLNNRLLAFQVSPKSYHAFLSNKKQPRNSMVMWCHSTEKYAIEKYGEVPRE